MNPAAIAAAFKDSRVQNAARKRKVDARDPIVKENKKGKVYFNGKALGAPDAAQIIKTFISNPVLYWRKWSLLVRSSGVMCSDNCAKKYVERYLATGSCTPDVSGVKADNASWSKVSLLDRSLLRIIVYQKPKGYLREHRDMFTLMTGIRVSKSTIGRIIKDELCLTRQKLQILARPKFTFRNQVWRYQFRAHRALMVRGLMIFVDEFGEN